MNEKVFEIISITTQKGDGRLTASELKERLNDKNLWDSLSHVELIFALEAEYDIFFSQEEIAEIDTPAKALAAVIDKGSSNET